MKKGLVIVNTGDGKGKTTAALGMALRAAGHEMKICIIQFIKGSWKYGEMASIKKFADDIDFHFTGKGFTWKSKDIEKDKAAAREAWNLAQAAMAPTSHYHLVVLDEFTYLLMYHFIKIDQVESALADRPAHQHVVITGRYAPNNLIASADLVTEMKAIKHPLQSGIKAQKGVEF